METLIRTFAIALLMQFIFGNLANAQIQAQQVGTGFTNPLFAASAPGTTGILYVVEQGGTIRSLDTATGTIGGTPLINLAGISGTNLISGGEQGLLGLAFHPDFQNNGLMYVNYTYSLNQSDASIRVEQYHVTGGVADPASRRTVIQYDHFGDTNHNAGWIGFNPMNGTSGGNSGQLYIMSGDGGGANDPANNAQNLNVLLGKTLRVDVGSGLTGTSPNYAIPSGNMSGANVRPEIYSYGLRNPFRASFDRSNGNLFIGDVGQGTREEIDFIANGSAGGQNFGWRLREGNVQTPGSTGGPIPSGYVPPIHDYDHTLGASVIGGYVYHGPARDDSGQPLEGHYFFGDFVSGRIFSFQYNGTPISTATERTAELGFTAGPFSISSFAEDNNGDLYVIDIHGTVYRIIPAPEPFAVGLVVGGAFAVGSLLKRIRFRSLLTV